MTPDMLLGIVPFKSFDDLTANKEFHQLLCCLHDEKKSVPHITLKALFSRPTSSVRFIFKDITYCEVIKLLYMSSEKLNSKENVRFVSE